MLFVAYYPEGAHVHDAECGELCGWHLEAPHCDVVWAATGNGLMMEVGRKAGWSPAETAARTFFYPCCEFDGVAVPTSEAEPPAPAVGVAAFRRRPLPFDEAEDEDELILDLVLGRRLTWINSLSGDREQAHLYPPGRNPDTGVLYNKQTKLDVTSSGRRILTFCATEGGFRSVALETLLEVR